MQFKKISLPFNVKSPILALGADIKNNICFAFGRFAFISEEIGDLSQIDNFNRFRNTIIYITKKFKMKPRIIAYDLHPEYQSSKYIRRLSAIKYQLSAIQHHHAHICACMIDNGLKNENVIGVAFDGTGFGIDQTLWGAEFLIANYAGFKRASHLRYAPLIGAEKAIQEPWRLAATWLYAIYKDKFLKLKIDFVNEIDKDKWFILKKMLSSNFNCPLSSSMGRLFDAVSALVLGNFIVNYEGQAAVELEKVAGRLTNRKSHSAYRFQIRKEKDKYLIDPKPMFKVIVLELVNKKSKEEIAYRFHLTVAHMIKEVCLRLRKDTKIKKLVLSGGVFQNRILLNLSLDLLYKDRFQVFFHKDLSSSDSNISLGQVAAANFKK